MAGGIVFFMSSEAWVFRREKEMVRVVLKKFADDEDGDKVEEGLNAVVKELEKNCCKVIDIDVKSIRAENLFLIKYEPVLGYITHNP
ncbi:hypothetical protein HUU53_00905 [Candidatus Micrarchaeota archaeon]|nr:hypothetical protein [Candidatus Micrarchaeota archaeon]